MAEEDAEREGVAGLLNNLTIGTGETKEEAEEGLAAALKWMLRRTGGVRERTREGRLNGHWDPFSFSLRMQSQAELR